jgi:N-acetylmuramate 1-kinase
MNTPSIAPERLEQIKRFLSATDFADAELHPLAGDASFRRYIRLRKPGHKPAANAMLMDAPPGREDVRPYLAVAEYLYNQGYSAPEILARDTARGLLLLEDLGDDSFTLLLKKAAEADKAVLEEELYASAIDVLAQWHDEGKKFSRPDALPLPVYGKTLMMQEVCLFADWYLPQVVGKERAAVLKAEYVAIWERIIASASLSTQVWVHRDYHADNLMWLPAREGARRVGLLDFQDGVYGDAAYDLVSLLEDARRDVPPQLCQAMLERYLAATGTDRDRFLKAYALLGAQRNCKIVGIFARLAARDNKFHYLNFLPRVWRHLENDVRHPSLLALKQWLDLNLAPDARGVITVRHTSKELALTA